jgi:hypothetical protein
MDSRSTVTNRIGSLFSEVAFASFFGFFFFMQPIAHRDALRV